jgi:hypothetical protein
MENLHFVDINRKMRIKEDSNSFSLSIVKTDTGTVVAMTNRIVAMTLYTGTSAPVVHEPNDKTV